mgnify:CR=1 FL=1
MEREVVGGRNAVLELLRSHRREVMEVIISRSSKEDRRLRAILQLARRRGVRVSVRDAGELNRIAPHLNHQGVLALVSPIKYHTLEELLDLAEGRVGLHIELKDGRALERVVRLVEAKGMVDEVFLTSGDPELLKKVKELNPQIKTELIFGDPPEDAVARALEAEAKRISCHHKFLTREFVREAHESGLEVIAWPPNTIEEMKKALDFGVDLICTDRPDIAVELREADRGGHRGDQESPEGC